MEIPKCDNAASEAAKKLDDRSRIVCRLTVLKNHVDEAEYWSSCYMVN